MQVNEVIRMLLRRKWASICAVLLSIGIAFAASIVAPPTYTATGSILILPPQVSATGVRYNPFLALSGLQSTADVVSRAMADAGTVAALKRRGVTGTWTVTRDLLTDGPVLQVDATNTSAAGALRSMRLIADQIPISVSQLQRSAGVPPVSFFSTQVIFLDPQAVAVRKSEIRAVIATFAVSIMVSLLAIALVERRRNRTSAPLPPAGPDTEATFESAPPDGRSTAAVIGNGVRARYRPRARAVVAGPRRVVTRRRADR